MKVKGHSSKVLPATPGAGHRDQATTEILATIDTALLDSLKIRDESRSHLGVLATDLELIGINEIEPNNHSTGE